MAVNIKFDSSSTLGAMTIIGLVAWIGGKSLRAALPSVGAKVSGIGQGVFMLGLIVWLLFVIPTILRNWGALKVVKEVVEGLALSSTSIRLRKGHLLPGKAKMIAEIVRDNEPVTRPELGRIVVEHDSLEEGDTRDNVRLLRMSNNLYIEDGEAFIDPVRCGENGFHVMEKFRRWKRKAQKN